MSVEAEMDAATEGGKAMAAIRIADELNRLRCAETESEFFNYVAEHTPAIIALLRAYAADRRRPSIEFGKCWAKIHFPRNVTERDKEAIFESLTHL